MMENGSWNRLPISIFKKSPYRICSLCAGNVSCRYSMDSLSMSIARSEMAGLSSR